MFEGANYFTVFLPSLVLVVVQFLTGNFRIWQQSWWTERHQLKEAAHRAAQQMAELPEPVYDRVTRG